METTPAVTAAVPAVTAFTPTFIPEDIVLFSFPNPDFTPFSSSKVCIVTFPSAIFSPLF